MPANKPLTHFRIIIVTLLTLVILFSLGLSITNSETSFDAPRFEWSKTYGEGDGTTAIQTADGGYAIAGGTKRLEVATSGPLVNPLLIKTDPSGEFLWNKTYGPEFGVSEAVDSVVQTKDLGYAMTGYRGWLLKTDSEGNVKWSKRLDVENSVVLRADDGGCLLAGDTMTHSGEVVLLKTDENGNLLWNKTYGVELSWLLGAIKTNDGGYALIGNYGGIWLAKIDSNGNLLSKKNYDVSFVGVNLAGASIAKTNDDGYVIAGNVLKSSYYVPWMIKIDSQGNMQWIQKYEDGGSFSSVVQLDDGEYLAAGNYLGLSFNNNPIAFFVRTDASGNVLWSSTYGEGHDGAGSVISDSGRFVAAGNLDSKVWLAKFGPESKIPRVTSITPAIDWQQSLKEHQARTHAAIQTADGGYAIAGENITITPAVNFRDSPTYRYSPLLIKTNSLGEVEWKKTYGSGSFNSIVQTDDNGYVLSGDNYFLKTDAEGNVQLAKNFYAEVRQIPAIQATDGGFALVGIADSSYTYSKDTVFIRTDENGNQLLRKTFSSGRPDGVDVLARDFTETADNGYAIVGTWGGDDFWFAKIDADGNLQANLTYTAITTGGAVLSSISNQ